MNEGVSKAYDLLLLKHQRDLKAFGIKYGSWEGYSEALKTRKESLKKLDDKIEHQTMELRAKYPDLCEEIFGPDII